MTGATLTRERVAGFDALVLENARVRAVILPSLGGRVWELTDRIRDRQWLWHRPGVPLAASSSGATYDDVWAGGWEELFPNDASGQFEGRVLPDHGAWWTTAWRVTDSGAGSDAFVRLEAETSTPRASCVKEFRLAADSDAVRASYRIASREDAPFHFLFKQHLPVALTPSCTLQMPGGRVTAVDPSFGTLLRSADPFPWPIMRRPDGSSVDVSRVLEPKSESREFVYVSELPEGWCGVDDAERGASLRMRFDTRRLPFAWLFLTYGGWRNCYTAVLEPCTNMPKDLAAALRAGHCARLDAGGAFETEVVVALSALAGAA